jgi:APA family basic amino acid/polyamine antiporter
MKEASGPPSLLPVLGRWQLLGIGIGAIIGSGIFVIPGPAAAQFAGPAITLSFMIAALGCALAGLCYAELSAMYPSAGSAYAFSTRAFGRIIGWLVGWLLILEYLFAGAIVAQSFAAYFAGLFSFTDPVHRANCARRSSGVRACAYGIPCGARRATLGADHRCDRAH